MPNLPLSETHVVTCFVMNPAGELLILRRSSLVGSYQGRWAGVSGHMESAPLEQAYTELREEVGLVREDVTLEKEGATLAVRDTGMDRLWIVHPFRFTVRDSSTIRLDWEHTEYRWIEPSELDSYPTVPGLADAFRRVSPP